MATSSRDAFALHGGPTAVTLDQAEANRWPILTDESDQAVLRVMHTMSKPSLQWAFERQPPRPRHVPRPLREPPALEPDRYAPPPNRELLPRDGFLTR